MKSKCGRGLLAAIPLGMVVACTRVNPPPDAGPGPIAAPTAVSKLELTTLARSTFELGAALQQTLVRDRAWASRNVVISPYSLCEAFGLVYAGARGDTAREIADAMRYGLTESQVHIGLARLRAELAELEATPSASSRVPVELLIANSAWAQTGLDIEPAYRALVEDRYAGAVEGADFARAPDEARAKINGWIKARTRGLVPELFPGGSLASATSLVVANTAYLHGTWEEPFPRSGTHSESFEKLDGSRVQIPTMHGALHAGYIEAPDYQAAELRYVGDRLSLFLVLPARGKFAQVEQGLNAALLSGLAEALPRARRNLRVSLPRVNLSVPLSLGASLAELGMKRAFGQGADFSGMVKGGGLFIGQVRHHIDLAIDEEQTEAAAATGIVMTYSRPADEIVMQVDRPFLFGIHDKKTGVLLFWGRIVDPSSRT